MIPKAEWKNWKPTPEMIRAAETVFLAMAHTETIRPIVEGYQRRILAEMQAKNAKEWRKHDGEKIILNPDHTYLMEDADFKTYLARCCEEQAKAGLHTDSPEYCPLLVAEHLQMKAEHCLIDIMEPVTGIESSRLYLENRKKYLDLILRLMAGHVHTATEILKRVA